MKREKTQKEKKKLTKKRLALRIVLCILGTLLLIVAGYVIYVFASYHRIPDNQVLTPQPDSLSYATMGRVPPQRIGVVPGEQTYSIMTYNIGFGAYTPDYSFFMDGGKYSWARSEDGLKENLKDIAGLINDCDPDFVVLQEVDESGTRTYHVNEVSYMQATDYFQSVYARNFDSPFLFWPLNEPHGANKSGLLTLSKAYISSALRRSLPVADSITKIVDYDRAYTISRIPLGEAPEGAAALNSAASSDPSGKELVIFNVHLSAYSTGSVCEQQLGMLFEDLQKEYAAGNYVICGGDFNHNLRNGGSDKAPGWAQPFPREVFPSTFSFGFDQEGVEVNISHDSCRNADEAYNPETTFTVLADGFIVSSNIEVIKYEAMDLQYAYSDHDPVVMEFRLKG